MCYIYYIVWYISDTQMTDSEHFAKSLLLISSSMVYGQGYLDHVEGEIRDVLGAVQRVAFVPFALYDCDAYATKARERFRRMGVTLESAHACPVPRRLIEDAQAIFIGGGNTFRLLKALYDYNLLDAIRNKVERGVPFVGSSAGSIVACPTLKTTKDMPVVEPPSFDALHLVSFQISPHYLDPDPRSTHMGETQEERIMQYLEENSRPVVGLREGSALRVRQGQVQLRGSCSARVFHRGCAPVEVPSGTNLNGETGSVSTRPHD
jgi:dipeptidase E